MAHLTLSSLQNLEDLLSPHYYGNEEPLRQAPPGTPSVPSGLTAQGYISQDCKWGYIFNGPVIQCFPVKTHHTSDLLLGRGHVPVVINTAGYHFPGSIINCAKELSVHSQRSNAINKLLLGLDCASDGGALVIYDPIQSQPLKWISLPAPVTSIAVLSHYEDTSCDHPFFNDSMMAMVGVAAVGLQGGKLLIIDLGLDALDVFQSTKGRNSYSYERKWGIVLVQSHEPMMAQKRRVALMNKRLICLDINNLDFNESEDDEGYNPEVFYYLNKAGAVLGTFNKDEVSVSCLQYVPIIGSLIVGFNFGGIQVWHVEETTLEFSTELAIQESPVHSIEFQQPIDDPKNFCYLWVLYGTRNVELQHSHAVLYALFYKRRTFNGTIALYENLENCIERLRIHLKDFYGPDENVEDSNTSLSLSSTLHLVRPLRMWNQGDNLLCISWESSREGIYYLGIFDLNQWYSNQTPGTLDCVGVLRLNPYWASISFQNPIDVHRNIVSQFCDVRIIPRSVERWENQFSKQDVHYYPASLTFQAVCLSSSGTFTFENFCIQEKLLRLIQKEGYQMMAEPEILRKLCSGFGLDPSCPQDSNGKISDQFYVFTALAENQRPALIIQMANRWVDGSMSNLGCDIALIINWISSLTTEVRCLVDEHWGNMARFQGGFLPPDTSHFINYSKFMWSQLNGILQTLVRHDRIYQDPEMDEDIGKLQYSLGRLIAYSSALLMMQKARILPVREGCDVITSLQQICSLRRSQLSDSLEQCPYLEPELRKGPGLLIDYLMDSFEGDFIRREWDACPGVELYPPKHPAFIFNMLLGNWMGEDSKTIARVIFYFILDVVNLVGHESTLRGNFSSLITLTPTEQQEVVKLWQIDHGEFDDPLKFLSEGCKINEEDGLPWSAAMVHMIAQGHSIPAVDILSRSRLPKLGKVLVNIVCDTHPRPGQKFVQIITSACFSREEDLLHHCFELASKKGFLETFVDMHSRHTPIPVQQALISYLNKLPTTFSTQQLLLMFFLRRKDVLGTREQFDKMQKLWPDRRNFTPNERQIWDTIVSDVNRLTSSSSKNFLGFLGCGEKPSITLEPLSINRSSSRAENHKTPKRGGLFSFLRSNPKFEGFQQNGEERIPDSPIHPYAARIKQLEGFARKEKVHSPDSSPTRPDSFSSPGNEADKSILGAKSPGRIDMESLLRSPFVEYAKPQDLNSESDGNRSVYYTPNATPNGSPSVGLHSILKKTETPLRKRVLLKPRFPDLPDMESSPEKEGFNDEEEEEVEHVESTASQTPLRKHVLLQPIFPDMENSPENKGINDEEEEEVEHVYSAVTLVAPDLELEVEEPPNAVPEEQLSLIDENIPEAKDHFTTALEKNWQEMDLDSTLNSSISERVRSRRNSKRSENLEIMSSNTEISKEQDIVPQTQTPASAGPSKIPKVVSRRQKAKSEPRDIHKKRDSVRNTTFLLGESEIKEEFLDSGESLGTVPESNPNQDTKTSKSSSRRKRAQSESKIISNTQQESASDPISSTKETESAIESDPISSKETETASESDPISSTKETTTDLKPTKLRKTGRQTRSMTPDLDAVSNYSGDIALGPTKKRITRSQSRAQSETREHDNSSIFESTVDRTVDFDTSILEAPSNVRVRKRRNSKKEEKLEEVSSDTMSEKDATQSEGKQRLPKVASRRKRAQSESKIIFNSEQASASELDLTSESKESTTKLRKTGRQTRSMTPDLDAVSNYSGDIALGPTRKRVTRSQSRAQSETREDDKSSIFESSMDTSVDFDTSILEAPVRKRRNSKKGEKLEGSDTASETKEENDAGQSEEKKKIPRVASRRKAKSEPRDIHTRNSSEFSDTTFIEEKPVRREIFGFAPGLSTVLEDSETSLVKTPSSSSRKRRSQSETKSFAPTPKSLIIPKSFENISEESPEQGASRLVVETESSKRRRTSGDSESEVKESNKMKRLRSMDEDGDDESDQSDGSTPRSTGSRNLRASRRRPKRFE